MGSLGGMLGIGPNAGQQGLGYNAGVNVAQPITTQNAQDAYTQAQQAIQGQQAFLAALQGQNGIANQSNVYGQLANVAAGTGPNPAQAMLAQSTGANTANQAALMAGQRGAGQNVGLIARQAAQQGGANQQAAAGQAATMQANQSLGALGQMGNLATQQVGQQAAATGAVTGAAQTQQAQLLGQINAQNTAQLQNQQTLSGMAQAGAKQQGQLVGGIIGGGASALFAKGGVVPEVKHYADGNPGIPDQSTPTGPNLDYAVPTENMYAPDDQGPQNINKQYPQSISSSPQAPVPSAPQAPRAPILPAVGGPKSSVGKFQQGFSSAYGSKNENSGAYTAGNAIGTGLGKGINSLFSSNSGSLQDTTPGAIANPSDNYATSANNFGTDAGSSGTNFGAAPLSMPSMGYAHGGKVPAMVSPGEKYLSPKEVTKVAKGEKAAINAGEKIPGKAKVKGDSLKNDIVPKTLEEGGIVLPRSVMESKNPHWEAHKFVSNILNKQGRLHSKRDKR